MRGTILDYDESRGDGLITGDDGERYSFSRRDISSAKPAVAGMSVDFIISGSAAIEIFAVPDKQQSTVFASAIPAIAASTAVEPELSLLAYAKRCVTRDYANFSGRARRKEFWGFTLFASIAMFALVIVIAVVIGFSVRSAPGTTTMTPMAWVAGAVYFMIVAALIVPAVAVAVRRFHDIGQSGWMYTLLTLLGLIPVVGFFTSIAVLVMTCLDGQPGPNKYGPPVKSTRIYAPN